MTRNEWQYGSSKDWGSRDTWNRDWGNSSWQKPEEGKNAWKEPSWEKDDEEENKGWANEESNEEKEEYKPQIDWDKVLPTLPKFEKDFYVAHPDVEARSPEEVAEILKTNKIQIIPKVDVVPSNPAGAIWDDSKWSTHQAKDETEENIVDENNHSIPKPVTNFIEASFPEYITDKLCQELGGPFVEPTPVQKLLWPIALSGRDCLAVSPTGTGKTLGYLLPAIVHISAQEPVQASDKSPIVLVVAPTRELAQQIMEQATLYGSAITDLGAQALTPVCIFGGVKRKEQQGIIEEKNPDFLVATPGRLMDFLNDGIITLRRVTYFVIDEVDRLIALNGAGNLRSYYNNQFVEDMKFISGLIRPDRQCIMCSATCTPDVMDLSRELCGNEPVFFRVTEADKLHRLIVNSNIDQQFAEAGDSEQERIDFLSRKVLPDTFTESMTRSEQKIIIFTNAKTRVDKVTEELRLAGWPAIGVHSGKVQEEREWIFDNFKSGVCNILVATDVMGRGMDFEDVRCVVNFDFPDSIETYIHRVGRTGRIGKKIKRGYALSLLTSRDREILPELEKMLLDSGLEAPEILKERIKEYEYGRGKSYLRM
jgi:ATP-dependent RNA helicase DDX5/DBP2